MANDGHNVKRYEYRPFDEDGAKGAEFLELRAQVETLSGQVESLSKQLEAKSKQVEALLKQLEAKSKQVESLSKQLEANSKQVELLSNYAPTPDIDGKGIPQPPPPKADGWTHIQQTSIRSDFSQSASAPEDSGILFRENAGNYNRILQTFQTEAEELKRSILSTGNADESAFLTLIDKCIRDFGALREKSVNADALDLAEESAKILKKTVCKALTKSELKPRIEKYLRSCGVKKLPWRVGKKLNDREYAYLEEPVFYDNVADSRKDGTITEIERDSYVIGYEEDGVPHIALIPGTYHIGKYRGSATYERP